MAEIKLTQEKTALIDDADLLLVSRYKWCAVRYGRAWYAMTHVRLGGGKRTPVFMHRHILGLVPGDPEVDHLDRDGLNNRRSNLRRATRSQNRLNSVGNQSSRKSPYKGVSWTKDTRYKGGGYWYARIMIDGKQYWRSAATEVEAAQKYNEMAKEHAGEFARPNGLVLVYVSCRFCGAPYQREIEPEYARLVQQHGICDACMELHEQARCMEVENGCS